MDCHSLTNDLLLAPTAEASDHLASCAECRERQKQTALAARALRALTDDMPLPERNEAAIRAAIPRLAQDAARRRPAGWWSVAAAAGLLAAAAIVGSNWSDWREEPAEKSGGGQVAGGAPPRQPQPPDGGKPVEVPPIEIRQPPPENGEKGGAPVEPVKPKDPPDESLAVRPGGGTSPGHDVPGVPDEKPPDVVVKPPDPRKPPDQPPLLTSADCLTIMKSVVGEAEPVSLDLNGDGRTDVADALLAARSVALQGGGR